MHATLSDSYRRVKAVTKQAEDEGAFALAVVLSHVLKSIGVLEFACNERCMNGKNVRNNNGRGGQQQAAAMLTRLPSQRLPFCLHQLWLLHVHLFDFVVPVSARY